MHVFALGCALWLVGDAITDAATPPGAPASDAPMVGSLQSSPTAAPEPFTMMRALTAHGLHDAVNERWALYAQATYIDSWKQPFAAAYTNLDGSNRSLTPTGELSFTGTGTLYLGLALWPSGELQFAPEVIAERPLSDLAGLGSTIQNFELQKLGAATPTPYISRIFVRHTFNLGGEQTVREAAPMQLGAYQDSRRLVVTVGNFSILDFFDRNNYASDLRQQWLSMAFLTHAAYDFAADARGYTWGAVVEYIDGPWAARIGHIAAPIHPNQLPLDPRVFTYFGDQLEVEHAHTLLGRPGVVRLLGYFNHEHMARFDDAVQTYEADPAHNAAACTDFNYGSTNPHAPDLCWARATNDKMGIGINIEQELLDGVGFFFRGMISDGETEVYSYTATDQSLSAGVLARGMLWARPLDKAGVAYGGGFISAAHARYLGMGGVDGFIGDGAIRHASEHVFEIFYSANMAEGLWLGYDYQHIVNPAYNADRGPVDILGMRIHLEL